MDFWRFLRGSENPSVLRRTRIFRFSEKLKKARITSQISLLTKQTLFIRLFVFCSFAPSPHGYTVSRGVPVRLLRMTQKTFPIKRREFVKIYTRRIRKFDEFLGFLTGSENPSVRVANLTFDQTNSLHSFVCLLLVCSFSPRVLSIPRGPQNP